MFKRIAGGLCLGLALAVLWLPAGARAADDPFDCTVPQEARYEGKLFAGLYKATQRTAKAFCGELVRSRVGKDVYDNAHMGKALQEFAGKSKKALDDLKLGQSADYAAQFTALGKTFGHFDVNDPLVPQFKTGSSPESGPEGYFQPLEGKTDRFAIKEVGHCATLAAGYSCRQVFDEFAAAFNPYRSGYDRLYGKNTELLADLGKRWDEFLEVSKSQTPLEVLLTTQLQRGHFAENRLVGPPAYQVIALHPQLVYDSLKRAEEGGKQELGLAVEWLGVNFWDLKVPLGISAASVYVDRAKVKDVGHGVMVHIKNHYAIGWANYGRGENSIYVTVDLLKIFDEKKAMYDDYVKSYL